MEATEKFFRVSRWYTDLAPWTWDTKFVKLRKEVRDAFASHMDEDEAKKYLYSEDGIHPNEEAQELIAKTIIEFFKKVL